MAQEVHVGTILISEWPQVFGLEDEPYSGRWSVVKDLDGFGLDSKIRAAGWHFFFLASEMKAMFVGTPGTKKINRAVNRILSEVNNKHFNGLEVTRIATKRFLGLPYVTVSAHPRHVQQNCYLDGAEARRLSRSSQNCMFLTRIVHQTSSEKDPAFSAGTD
jgi:hypothetical protein